MAEWIFEAPQAVASTQRLDRLLPGCRVSARYPTVETQAQLFGNLYRLFADRRLVLFPHDRLRKETLNLVTKTAGGRLKVIGSNAIHQDHVIALGGAAEMVARPNAGDAWATAWRARAARNIARSTTSPPATGGTPLAAPVPVRVRQRNCPRRTDGHLWRDASCVMCGDLQPDLAAGGAQ